jgi:hypothetical protein
MSRMAHGEAAGCFVCRKHRERGALLPGGAVGEDELTVVSHLAPAAPEAQEALSTWGIFSWNPVGTHLALRT